MQYKVDGEIFDHCKKIGDPKDLTDDHHLVLALVEGEHDFWLIDDPIGFAEIQRYYKSSEGITYAFKMLTYIQVHEVVIN